jgi:hypothetical protein
VEVFDALGKSGRLDRRAVIQICPSASIGMCGYSKTTINEVVAAGYKAICEWAPAGPSSATANTSPCLWFIR